jgi:hypothetical protein
MEAEGLAPYLKAIRIDSTPIYLQILFNIILSSTTNFTDYNFVRISQLFTFATRLVHRALLCVITQQYYVQGTNYKAPNYVIFFTSLNFISENVRHQIP